MRIKILLVRTIKHLLMLIYPYKRLPTLYSKLHISNSLYLYKFFMNYAFFCFVFIKLNSQKLEMIALKKSSIFFTYGEKLLLKGNYKYAELFFQKSLKVLKENQEISNSLSIRKAIASLLLIRNDVKSALFYLTDIKRNYKTDNELSNLLIQCLHESGQISDALEIFDSYDLQGRTHLLNNLSVYILQHRESYAKIWGQYKNHKSPHPKSAEHWDGQHFEGKLLVTSVSGIGDEIRFASVYNDLARYQTNIIFSCEPRLLSIFKRSFPKLNFIAHARSHIYHLSSQKRLKYTFPIEIKAYNNNLEVLRIIRKDKNSFKTPSFLIADENRVGKWQKILRKDTQEIIIGLCWRSGIKSFKRVKDHFKLAELIPLLKNSTHKFICLQYDGIDDLLELPKELRSRIEFLKGVDIQNNFEDLAAIMTVCNLVISSPTNVAEFAGILNRPTLMLTKTRGMQFTWRIQRNQKDLIFPSMKHISTYNFQSNHEFIKQVLNEIENNS